MRSLLIPAVFLASSISFTSPALLAQDSVEKSPPSQFAGQLSPVLRSARYPEAIYPHGVLPHWDRGYVIRYDETEPASSEAPNVTVYNREGAKVLQAHVWLPDAATLKVHRAAATHQVGVLASGASVMHDGSVQRFIAKTDSSGKTIQSILTGSFVPAHLCEAEDGTVWTLGKEITDYPDTPDKSAMVLRQFSFDSGLLHAYLPRGSVEAVVDSEEPWFSPYESRLACGKDKISAYLEFTDEYVEVDPKSFAIRRWKLDLGPVNQGKANGLAVTDDGHVYLSSRPGWRSTWSGINGLFEVKGDSSSAIATLQPVKGSIYVHRPSTEEKSEPSPPGTLWSLWGADGNELALWLADGDDVSWVRVLPVSSEGN